jgi:hypothetical protein
LAASISARRPVDASRLTAAFAVLFIAAAVCSLIRSLPGLV